MFRMVVHVDVKKELQALPAIVQAKMIRQLDKLRQNPIGNSPGAEAIRGDAQ